MKTTNLMHFKLGICPLLRSKFYLTLENMPQNLVDIFIIGKLSVSHLPHMNSAYSHCRVVSQVEYPSLVDLRGLLLDLVAQLLGALSRIR